MAGIIFYLIHYLNVWENVENDINGGRDFESSFAK